MPALHRHGGLVRLHEVQARYERLIHCSDRFVVMLRMGHCTGDFTNPAARTFLRVGHHERI
jgi:hypothetical protein